MRSILKILETMDGDHVRIENGSYMPLVVEKLGAKGPRGWPLVSVAHYGEQNGDAMRDPEMVFEWTDHRGPRSEILAPVYFRNDYMGVEQYAVESVNGGYYLDEGDKRYAIRRKLLADLKAFARTWDRNICEQGFPAKMAGKVGA